MPRPTPAPGWPPPWPSPAGPDSCAAFGLTTGPRRGRTHADVIEVLSAVGSTPGAQLDVVVLPKVSDVSHVQALDLLLAQLETVHGLPAGGIGIDAQIEDARGLTNIEAIAAAPRVQALVLGPADLTASLNMRTRVVGEQPEGYDVGDAYHHVLMTILIAARAHGIAAMTGRTSRCAMSRRSGG